MKPLSDLEARVVDLLDEGYARWKIADMLGLGETTIRDVIKRLCERYQCSQRDLPQRVEEEESGRKEPGV
jgi:DNA-binding NarL/FixJ family response regulator